MAPLSLCASFVCFVLLVSSGLGIEEVANGLPLRPWAKARFYLYAGNEYREGGD